MLICQYKVNRRSDPFRFTSGYALTRLLIGSEGALGIITEIVLKISPKPLAVEDKPRFFCQPTRGRAGSYCDNEFRDNPITSLSWLVMITSFL